MRIRPLLDLTLVLGAQAMACALTSCGYGGVVRGNGGASSTDMSASTASTGTNTCSNPPPFFVGWSAAAQACGLECQAAGSLALKLGCASEPTPYCGNSCMNVWAKQKACADEDMALAGCRAEALLDPTACQCDTNGNLICHVCLDEEHALASCLSQCMATATSGAGG